MLSFLRYLICDFHLEVQHESERCSVECEDWRILNRKAYHLVSFICLIFSNISFPAFTHKHEVVRLCSVHGQTWELDETKQKGSWGLLLFNFLQYLISDSYSHRMIGPKQVPVLPLYSSDHIMYTWECQMWELDETKQESIWFFVHYV